MRLVDCLNARTGLYTFREASIFAKIPISTLRYWFVGTRKHAPVRDAVVDDAGLQYITFLDFIEAVAIRELRTQYQLTLPKIREAVLESIQAYGIKYPFSDQRHAICVFGKELQIYPDGQSNPIQLTGKSKKQVFMKPVADLFMKALRFNEQGHGYEFVAAQYDRKVITLNPHIMFGSPRVSQSPYSAITLWRARKAEGEVDAVARLYKVDAKSVVASCRYCEEELRLAA